MKLLALLTLAATSAMAGELYQHITSPFLDVYVDSSVSKDPDIPGMGDSYYSISISLTTTDTLASVLGIYMRVQFADGTQSFVAEIIRRTDYKNTNVLTTTKRFDFGELKPVKIVALNIVRYHPESSDQLIHP
jgi:hypothetical protein